MRVSVDKQMADAYTNLPHNCCQQNALTQRLEFVTTGSWRPNLHVSPVGDIVLPSATNTLRETVVLPCRHRHSPVLDNMDNRGASDTTAYSECG